MKNTTWILLLTLVLLSACGGHNYVENPTDQFVKEYFSSKTFSVVLFDMDVNGTFFKSYKHKYKIIAENSDGEVNQADTDWIEVSPKYFQANENNLGMELVSKGDDGKINKSVGPAGFNSYVGNSRYGEWRSDGSGGSMWAFYGRYMFMSQMFGLMGRPAYYRHYNDYYSNYRYSRPYYGTAKSGGSRYGTNSAYTKKSRPNFYTRKSRKGWSNKGRSSNRYSSRGSSRSRSWGSSRGFGRGK